MKVCKFGKINDEDGVRRVVSCVLAERPYVAVLPVLAPLSDSLQKISVSWFHDEDSALYAALDGLETYCRAFTAHVVTETGEAVKMMEHVEERVANMRKMIESKQDLLIDKLVKAEVYMLSAELMACCLRQHGLNVKILDTARFMQIDEERMFCISYVQETMRKYVGENRDAELLVAPLSMCKNAYGETDFISDKRSDYYAAALAAILGADELILSTRLDNIYTNINSARELHSLTYAEAGQLVSNESPLVYTDCITLAARYNMAVRLTDVSDPDTERLYISSRDTGNSVKAILAQDAVTFVRFTSRDVLPGYLILGKLLDVVERYKINVISMSSSNVSVSMIVAASRDTLRIIRSELGKYVETLVSENMSAIHVIGSLNWERTQLESEIMETIRDVPVSFISYGGSSHCFTVAVHSNDKKRILGLLSMLMRCGDTAKAQ